MDNPLKLGDIVFLKSGSMPLTVTEVADHDGPDGAVEVTWWSDDSDDIRSLTLPLAALCYVDDLVAANEPDDDQPANGGTTH